MPRDAVERSHLEKAEGHAMLAEEASGVMVKSVRRRSCRALRVFIEPARLAAVPEEESCE